MSNIRTFIAIEASEEVRSLAVSAIRRLQTAQANVKWVAPENMHWTLKFLGDVQDVAIAEVCQRVARAVDTIQPFTIHAGGVGGFPRPTRPRTLWLGIQRGNEQIVEVQQQVDSSLTSMGFRSENRRFVPHMTLGRVGRGMIGVERLGELLQSSDTTTITEMKVREVVIFSSDLERTGPVHEPMGRATLGG